MKLSTRGRYATLALLDLALHPGEGPVQLKDIARRQEIPQQYLEHLIGPLITGGLVRSIRGAKGGVWLAKEPHEIKLSKVIELLEGGITPVECVTNPMACARSGTCVTRDVWSDMKTAVDGVLEATSLLDLVERHRKKIQPKQDMYHI